jgi:hypothetical protein
MTALCIDDPSSWPAIVTSTLASRFHELVSYENERQRISRLCSIDVSARMLPPENRFQHVLREVLQETDLALANVRVRGWHCTRLSDDEVRNIRSDGLVPLSEAGLLDRIAARVRAGDIPLDLQVLLEHGHQADCEGRSGAVHVSFTRRDLSDEGAVGRLLRSWGGEALYNSHEADPRTGNLLRKIGKARIVVVSVPVSDVRTFQGFAETIYRYHMELNGISTADRYDCEGTLSRIVVPSEIEDVFSFGEPEFKELIDVGGWRCPPC